MKLQSNQTLRIETRLTCVSLRNDGILEIRFKQNEYEVDVEDQWEILHAVEELTQGGTKPYPILVIPGLYGGITPKARAMEMFTQQGFKNQKALAIVVHALHQRLLGKLFIAFKKHKPEYPHSLFSEENKAVNWLLSL